MVPRGPRVAPGLNTPPALQQAATALGAPMPGINRGRGGQRGGRGRRAVWCGPGSIRQSWLDEQFAARARMEPEPEPAPVPGQHWCLLPSPSLHAHPDNAVQLLDEEQRAEKEMTQALWCGEEDVSVQFSSGADTAVGVSSAEWAQQLQRLEAGQQPEWREALEDFKIPAGDPRIALVGQRAVRVRGAATIAAAAAAVAAEQQRQERRRQLSANADAATDAAAAAADAADVGAATSAGASPTIPSGSVLLHYAGTVRTQDDFDDRYTPEEALINGWTLLLAVKKRHFCAILNIKRIILPRQARDKHRKTQKKSGCVPFRLGCAARPVTLPGEKTALFAPFIYKNQHFAKTGSGQT
jgi:hypothetical protein